MPWEQALPRSRQDDSEAWEATDFTFPSRYVEIPRPIQDYARPSFPVGRPIGEAVVELMHRIHRDFRYESGSTTLTTKVSDLLEKRTGVCQDFAHVMVASLRSLGLAGRYVSGYLATRPAPGKPRQVEDAASHAWVGCWIPDAGWLYLDPTNDRLIDDCMPRLRGVVTTATAPCQGCDLHRGEEIHDGRLGRRLARRSSDCSARGARASHGRPVLG
jgi:transglutaminase-like putative cysteine protease